LPVERQTLATYLEIAEYHQPALQDTLLYTHP
jgi:hypothetical protein